MPKAGLEKTTIDTGTGARKTIRMDTVRGILVFVEKRRTVYVSSELSPIEREGKHRRPDEAAQRSIELDKQLLNFARQVQVLD
jgi:hypothetical protein